MRQLLFMLLLLAPLAGGAQDSPFKNVTFQEVEFAIPGGKTVVLKADGSVKWPKGTPSTATQAFCDALVSEKAVDVSTVKSRVNNDDNASADYDNKKAIEDWNALVVAMRTDGGPKIDNVKQARAAWKCLKKLFPHVFK